MSVSGRTAVLILLAAGGLGLVIALAGSPGTPQPGQAPTIHRDSATITVVSDNGADVEGQ
jgi:hypothetical protein